ncbi:MAG TPA: peroxide stress protein YaaA [Planctomycetes bacterium]|nr:peroxide stress protein YaaA [Planctomycetota bacterium]
MLALISPAKRLNEDPWDETLRCTQPALLEQALGLVEVCRELSPPDLQRLMKISEPLAELNFTRFQDFSTPFSASNAKPAGLTFAGDTYVGLAAHTFDEQDWAFAQDHLGILSGLFGLLRPLDYVQAYRLEMGTRLATPRGKSLYDYWGDRVSDLVNERTAGHTDRRVINLASKEYIKVVDPSRLAASGITMTFKELKQGKARVIGLFAKKARGSMARWMIKQRVQRAEELQGFDEGGYEYRPDLSSDVEWVYTRPQP